jgi:hypothetical protein
MTGLSMLDLLDSREKALLIWAGVVVTYGASKNWHAVASSGKLTLRAALRWKLLLLFGTAAVYCAGVAFLAARMGVWHTTAAKETAYWFFTGGLVLADYAVTRANALDASFYRWLFGQAVRFTILVEFLINLYIFPFVIELAVVPIVLVLVLSQVAAASEAALAPVRKPIEWTLVAIIAFLLGSATVRAAFDPSSFFTRENVETFIVTPAFTIAFVPFVAVWAVISQWEQARLRLRFRPRLDTP